MHEKHQIHNEIIGKSYQIINRFVDYEEFQKLFKQVFGFEHVADNDETANETTKNVNNILITEMGEQRPLYSNSEYYVMTENGSTFERVINVSR